VEWCNQYIMSFQNYKTANIATGTISVWISAWATSVILNTWQGDLFPSSYPYLLKIEKYDSWSTLENKPVTKREIVKVTNKSGDTFTIVRSAWYCPATSTATTQTNTAYSFDVGDSVFLVMPAEQIKDIQDEVVRLETDKADDADVVHITGDEDVDGVKTFLESPNVPTAVNATEAVNKGQMDSSIIRSTATESIYGVEEYIMWETWSPWEVVMPEPWPTFAQATSRQKVWDVTANTRVSIPRFWNWIPFNTFKLSLDKTLSPSADISIRIEEDDGTLKSSGNLYDPIATATILAWVVTNSPVDTTFTFAGSTVANGHGVTLATTSATTDYKWVSFTLTSQESFISCTKSASCTATKAYLYDSSYTLLQTVTFSGNIAVFNNTSLVLWQTYHILAGSDGSSYTQAKQSWASAYPYTATKLDYINGIVNWPAVTDTLTVSWYFGDVWPSSPTFAFSVNAPCFITSVPSLTGRYGTSNAQLSLNGNVLETWTLWVFTGNTILTPWNTYQISYSTAVVCGQYLTVSFPQVKTSVTYISSSWWRRDMPSYKFPAEVTTKPVTIDADIYNITSISSAGNLYIPDWQLVHIVAYVWAYGAETINASNYYNIWYSTNHTTTRPMRTYNGSVWSSALNSQFAYISSAGLHDIVFTKTDADYTYKLPVDWPRLLTQATAMWQKPIVTRRFLNNVLSGMTRLTKMFLANTPWAMSAIPWTNRYAIWVAKSATELEVGTEYYGYGDWLTILSSDSEITNTNTTLTKVKEIVSNSQFTWNVYFEIKTNTTTGWKQWEWRIYVNGVAVWTLRTINTSAYASYNEYITVNAWDLIQIYARVNDNSAWYTVYIRNFRLRASVVTPRDNIGYTIT